MPAEFPQVTRAADRRPRYRPGRLVSGIRLQSRVSDQQIDLADLETCHLDIEGEVKLGELAQLLAKKLFVQVAISVSRLSAIAKARAWAGFKCSRLIVGTSERPSSRAARSRP